MSNVTSRALVCQNILPYRIDRDAICEAQLLNGIDILARTYQMVIIIAQDYNVYKISLNQWLIVVADAPAIIIQCGSGDIISQIINTNSHLKLLPECTHNIQPVTILFTCCNLPEKIYLLKLKATKFSKINNDD